MTAKHTLGKIIRRKIERHLDVYLFPSRVKKQLESRQGNCRQCGKCCKLVFKCPMLDERSDCRSCRIYSKRSKVCSLFPFHPDDLKDVGHDCGYSFK